MSLEPPALAAVADRSPEVREAIETVQERGGTIILKPDGTIGWMQNFPSR